MIASYLSEDNINVNHTITLDIPSDSTSYLDAICEYVHRIAEKYPPPYTLFVSGGVDSQALLYIWKRSGVPFTAVNVWYHGFNSHDFTEIAKFAQQLEIPIKQIAFNILDFLENRLDDYAMKYECSSPQLCTHMAFSELIEEGTKIFSGNIPLQNITSMNNTIFGLQRYATKTNANLIPFFLMMDEKSASIAAHTAINIPENGMDAYEFKCHLYNILGIPVIPQKSKLTGFELLKDYYDLFPERVTKSMRLRHSSIQFTRVFDHLFRNKYMVILNNHYLTKFLCKTS